MKRTTLRTSAIALGVAAALPATGQEWNLAWGGYMSQHVAFGSNEHKTMVNVNDLSYTFDGDESPNNPRTGDDIYTATVHLVAENGDDVPDGALRLFTDDTPPGAIDWGDPASIKGIIQTAVNTVRGTDETSDADTFYIVVGETNIG
ncbi:MAG: hypothetical protein OXC72_06835, partial [Roseovarius sp.]|nr:hypothetical protein [Roseovarius sp.]